MEIIAYEMKYTKADIEKSNISSIPFEQRYFEEYMIRMWRIRNFRAILPTPAGRVSRYALWERCRTGSGFRKKCSPGSAGSWKLTPGQGSKRSTSNRMRVSWLDNPIYTLQFSLRQNCNGIRPFLSLHEKASAAGNDPVSRILIVGFCLSLRAKIRFPRFWP